MAGRLCAACATATGAWAAGRSCCHCRRSAAPEPVPAAADRTSRRRRRRRSLAAAARRTAPRLTWPGTGTWRPSGQLLAAPLTERVADGARLSHRLLPPEVVYGAAAGLHYGCRRNSEQAYSPPAPPYMTDCGQYQLTCCAEAGAAASAASRARTTSTMNDIFMML